MKDWLVGDIETYRNMFSAGFVHVPTMTRWIFEVSDRRNQSFDLYQFLKHVEAEGDYFVGFNIEHFDWPVLDHCLRLIATRGFFTAVDAYEKAQQIISSQNRFEHVVWASDRTVKLIDLFKIHHFDNPAKSTSLKKLEINMWSPEVIDLPYSPHSELTPTQMDHVIAYMCHDISETLRFLRFSEPMIRFREELAEKYPDLGDVLNFNDTKVGKKFFEREIERAAPGTCYQFVDGRRRPRQTWRTHIAVADIISPKVFFRNDQFMRVLNWLKAQVLRPEDWENLGAEVEGHQIETKGVFKGLSANINGFDFVFGTGGIHGSIERQTVREDDEFEIIDFDVASFYPNLAIVNGWYPKHLGEQFPETYKAVYDMRKSYGKKTAENAMLKLALNGVYGDSNSRFGIFYDPQYTMTITINGQLMLCMLAEAFLQNPAVQMIQANTDGITIRAPRQDRPWIDSIVTWWQSHTGLELESVNYRSMHIRDVNSYIAVKLDGSVKRIGAYAYETPMENVATRELSWHKDHSRRVVMKAVEAQMVHGIPVDRFIFDHRDPFDFMVSIKVPRSSRLEANGAAIQNTSRYYLSTDGVYLTKIMPPVASKPGVERHFSVEKGYTVTVCNEVSKFRWDNVNWFYYINEARKLVI